MLHNKNEHISHMANNRKLNIETIIQKFLAARKRKLASAHTKFISEIDLEPITPFVSGTETGWQLLFFINR